MTTTPVEAPADFVLKETGPMGEGVIVGIIGNKRKGKGIVASVWLWLALRAGVPIFHLGNLAFGNRIDDLDFLARQDAEILNNCIINLDEIKATMPAARASSTFQILLDNAFVQSGHQNISVLWTSTTESGVTSGLLEQTEYVLWIDNKYSRRRRWTQHQNQTCKQYAATHRRSCNHCAAWYPESPFHAEHIGPGQLLDCRKSDHQRTIVGVRVSQEASSVGVGERVPYTLYCAQRFYPLQHTDVLIESSVLTMTGENITDRRNYDLQQEVKRLLITLAADMPVATTDDIAEYLEGTYGHALGFPKVRALLRDCGVPIGTRKGVSVWRLDDWIATRRSDAAEDVTEPDELNEEEPGRILDFDEPDD